MVSSNKIFSLSVPRSKKGEAVRKHQWRFQDPTAFGDISYAKKVFFFFLKKTIIKYPSLSVAQPRLTVLKGSHWIWLVYSHVETVLHRGAGGLYFLYFMF